MAKSLVSLQAEAKDLNITFDETTKAADLQAKIDAFYAEQEAKDATSVSKVIKESSEKEVNIMVLAKQAELEARKTRVVIITDNDSRVNNVTTMAVVDCFNAYFDLGTTRIPLNEPVEVMQGHINALAEVKIPIHLKDDSGNSRTVIRTRYNIQYVK